MTVTKTDLVLPGRMAAVVERRYHPADPFGRVAGFELSTGPGWSLSLDIVLLEVTASLRRLILPGNTRVAFTRQPDGTFANTTDQSFAGAVLSPEPDGAHRLRFKDGRVWRFTSGFLPRTLGNLAGVGLLAEQVDRAGNRLTISRDEFGAITQVMEPGGRVLSFITEVVASSVGRLRSVSDPLGRTVRYGYASTFPFRLETVTDPAGGVTRYSYTATGGIASITAPRGITFLTNEHDGQGRVIRQTQADGGVWSFAYTGPAGAHSSVSITDPRGQVTLQRLSATGLSTEILDALGPSTRFTRDPAGRVLERTDPLGRVTRGAYDAAGNLTTLTDPAGQVWRFTYEPTFNRVTSRTDPLGQVTSFTYDGQGNLTAVTDPVGGSTSIAYSTVGQPVSVTDPLGQTTTFTYDAQGNLVTVIDPLGNTTRREYDAVSRLTRQINALGQATNVGHDALNRIEHVLDALAGLTRFTYDGNGNLLTVTDARGSVRR